jgi:NAD(P)-dependent dehydrogenase (short-subunit alcohol dehydrogenase family)
LGYVTQLIDGVLISIKIESVQAIATANGTKAIYHQANATDATDVGQMFHAIKNNLRYPLRGCVAAAGISGEGDACDYDINVFRKIIDVNVTGTFLVVREVAKEIHRASVSGSIVIIASMSGWVSNKVRFRI